MRLNSKLWFRELGKWKRGKLLRSFKGIYYKGRKRVGLRKFLEIKVGSKIYVLTSTEFNRRTKKRII